MSQAFIGEIRAFGFSFAPVNWVWCNGQLMDISQNTALYQVIGTTYGGNGTTNFGIPDLQGRVPMHWGSNNSGMNTTIGQVQGSTTVTLTTAQTPAHTHTLTVQAVPAGGVVERTAAPKQGVSYLSDTSPGTIYQDNNPTFTAQFAAQVLSLSSGGSQPHDNMQPYLAINFCMCQFGIFPSRN